MNEIGVTRYQGSSNDSGMCGIREDSKSKTSGQCPLAFNIQNQDKSFRGIELSIKVN
jgi:hypothetical protein